MALVNNRLIRSIIKEVGIRILRGVVRRMFCLWIMPTPNAQTPKSMNTKSTDSTIKMPTLTRHWLNTKWNQMQTYSIECSLTCASWMGRHRHHTFQKILPAPQKHFKNNSKEIAILLSTILLILNQDRAQAVCKVGSRLNHLWSRLRSRIPHRNNRFTDMNHNF